MKVIHCILSLCLIMGMLLSQTGIRLSQHWCGDQLVNATIFGEAAPCTHATSSEYVDCPVHGKMLVTKNCCNQKATIIDGSESDSMLSAFTFEWHIDAIEFRFQSLASTLLQGDHILNKFQNHSPPLLVRDIWMVVQVFRI